MHKCLDDILLYLNYISASVEDDVNRYQMNGFRADGILNI